MAGKDQRAVYAGRLLGCFFLSLEQCLGTFFCARSQLIHCGLNTCEHSFAAGDRRLSEQLVLRGNRYEGNRPARKDRDFPASLDDEHVTLNRTIASKKRKVEEKCRKIFHVAPPLFSNYSELHSIPESFSSGHLRISNPIVYLASCTACTIPTGTINSSSTVKAGKPMWWK